MAGAEGIDWFAFVLGVLAGFGLCWVLARRRRRGTTPPGPLQAIELPADVKAIVLRYRAEGRSLDAIRMVRERTGCDLRTAKYLVDHLR